ncbi:hypothetical protein BAP_179 [Bacillus sp. CN2]|nr:hypothetical protein BAP_179 [Bacillus sp. CN2]
MIVKPFKLDKGMRDSFPVKVLYVEKIRQCTCRHLFKQKPSS